MHKFLKVHILNQYLDQYFSTLTIEYYNIKIGW